MMKWGSQEWFLNKLTTQGVVKPAAYFSYKNNGYQSYRRQRLVSYLREHTGGKLQGNLLDIGCGTGELTASLKEQNDFHLVVGVDFLEPALEYARKTHHKIRFELANLPELAFSPESFDVVVAAEVIYYLSERQRYETLVEIARILKRGGIFYFSSVLGMLYFTPQSARKLIGKFFEIERVWYDHNRLYHLSVKPAKILNDLFFIFYVGTKSRSKAVTRFAKRYRKYIQNPLVYRCFKSLCMLTDPLLSSEILPRLLGNFSQRFMPHCTLSNITFLARKN